MDKSNKSDDSINKAEEVQDNLQENVDNSNEESVASNAAAAANADTNFIFEAYSAATQNLVRIYSHYLMRLYDITIAGESEIEEVAGMPRAFEVLLRDSVENYRHTSYFEEYLPIVELENRSEELRIQIGRQFIDKGNTLGHNSFLTFCAPFVLAAYDLKKLAGFTEAPDCVAEALVHAIILTDQRACLDLWRLQLGVI